LLSKKCVQLIIKNQESWNHEYWDDVGLALLLKELKVIPLQVSRYDIPGNPYFTKVPTDYYQYRCRADNHYGYPRFIESHVLKYLHFASNGKNYPVLKKYFYLSLLELSKFFYIYQFGWKVYSLLRIFLKVILPNNLYTLIKKRFAEHIKNFKLVRFKT